ncbi:hypothetical protein ACFVH6_17545 [Spirillospora sp. NPDC127200]
MPVRIVVVLALLLGAAGCGGDGGAVRVPPGFVEHRAAEFGFAHPAGWRRAEERDDQGRPLTTFRGAALPSGVPDGHVHAQRYADHAQGFPTALAQFRDLARFNGYRLTADRPADVDGAVRAHRFEASYTLDSDQGGPVSFRLAGLYVLTEQGALVEFVLRAPEQGGAVARLPQIMDTFRLRGD